VEGFVDDSALFAVFGHADAAQLTVLGLSAEQHRGDATAAIAVADGRAVRFRRGSGLVRDVFPPGSTDALPGTLAIGQVSGMRGPRAAADSDPDRGGVAYAHTSLGPLAVAVAGRFTNGARLRRQLLADGAVLHGASDAEVMLHLVARSGMRTFVNRVVDAAWRLEGAYVLLVAGGDRIVALRDPAGVRPLVLGGIGEAVVLATEDAALRAAGAEVRREVAPGEMTILHGRRAETVTPFPKAPPSRCAMEHISAAGEQSTVFTRNVHHTRLALGEKLARAHPCAEADVVVGLAGPGDSVALGFARAAKLPYDRDLPSVVGDRTVVLVAPAFVTGQPLRRAVRAIFEAGARGVHVRSASPAARALCPYGLRPTTPDEILAPETDVEIASWLGAHSFRSLRLDDLRGMLGDEDGEGLCTACLTGVRPIEVEEPDDQLPLF
jgi:amidophosphoribosyltransferase